MILVLAFSDPCIAQEEKLVEEYIDNYTEGLSDYFGSIIEDVNDLLSNPLFFNSMSRSDLAAIPFLSENQIEMILSFRDSVKADIKWDDVFGLISASQAQREVLPKLIRINDSVIRYREYRAPVRILTLHSWWRNIEKAQGFYDVSGPAAFTGPQYGLRSRVQVSGRDFNIKAIAESDPGEADFRKADHFSAGVEVNPGRDPFRILFGDYHFSAGRGLGYATRPVFRSWKADPHMQINRGRGFGLHGSSDENKFLRGAALEYTGSRFSGRLFFSSRDTDATIKESGDKNTGDWDTGERDIGDLRMGSYMSGIYPAGLHRSDTEIAKKNSVYEEAGGVSLEYRGMKLELGGLLAHFSYSQPFQLAIPDLWPQPEPEYMNNAYRYSLWGRGLIGSGMLAWEMASTSTGGYALEAAWSGFRDSGLAYSIMYEGCGKGFFSHNSTVSSSIVMSGGYSRGRVNISYQPKRKWRIFGETGLSASLQPAMDPLGGETYIKSGFNYTFSAISLESTLQARPGKIISVCKIRESQKDRAFYWQAETGFSSDKVKTLFTKPGSYLMVRARYQAPSGRLRIQAGISLFTGSETSCPFYTYEPDVYYGMSLPALSGAGSRTFILVKYNILNSLYMEAKISRVDYDDRTEIGTSYDRIDSNHRTGVRVQVVYRTEI